MSSSGVDYRTNSQGLLEVFHPETGSYVPVTTLLQIIDGLRVTLAPKDFNKIQEILQESQQIESSFTSHLQQLFSTIAVINSKLSISSGGESTDVANFLLRLVNDLDNVKTSLVNLQEYNERIWFSNYDTVSNKSSVNKLGELLAGINSVLSQISLLLTTQDATNTRLNSINGDMAILLNRVVEVRDRISGGGNSRVRLNRSALDINNTLHQIDQGYVKLSLGTIKEPAIIGGISFNEGSGIDEEYNTHADYPAISIDTRGGGRVVGWVYKLT